MIDPKDLNLIHRMDDVQTVFKFLKKNLPQEAESTCPAVAKATFSKQHFLRGK